MVFRGVLIFWLLLAPALGVAAPEPAVTAGEPAGEEAGAVSVGQAVAPAPVIRKNVDPWEHYNRTIYRFNDRADRYVLKPVAKGYVAITPKFVRTGITNFFINLRSPLVILNDLLQGKVKQAGGDTVRFVVNSTAGVAGFIDVAVRMRLPMHDEDFGQTMGKWGVNPGPYLVLPFLGPSSVRDTVGFTVDSFANPRRYLLRAEVDWALLGMEVVSSRASLLDLESIIQGDRYLFIRDLYLQRRDFAVKDGVVDDPFLDDGEYQDEPPADSAPEAPAAPPDAGATNQEPQILGAPETDAILGVESGKADVAPAFLPPLTVASGTSAAMEYARF